MSIEWITAWEKDLSPEVHDELAAFLRMTFNGIGTPEAELFAGRRSWAGARPELRVYGRNASGAIVAHIGVLRRYVLIGDVSQLVAEGGLVAVHPDLQRTGVGTELASPVRAALRRLKVPFAFGTCSEDVVPFYLALGAHRLEGVRVRTLDSCEPWCLRLRDLPVLITPLEAGLEQWPAGDVLDRNGQEV